MTLSVKTKGEKHRLEKAHFSVDWAHRGVTPTGNPTIAVLLEESAGVWTDKTAEFGVDDLAISGTKSLFSLGIAGTGQQNGGVYQVRTTQVMTDGQTLVSVNQLTVSEKGDENAPAG